MNLKDLDPKLFREAIEAFAEEAKRRFARDVDERVETLKRGIEDVAQWNLPTEMSVLFAQWFSKEAVVFTARIPDPNPGIFRYENEGEVRLKFSGYEFDLGHMKNLNELHNSRVILIVVPQKKETKP